MHLFLLLNLLISKCTFFILEFMQVDKCTLEYFINKKVIFESLDLYLANIRLFRELKNLLYEKNGSV